jgi:FtsZ-binding cell division protein ZapB
MEKKKKYITKRKRIKLLQQEVEELKSHITRLTQQLDAANEKILADNPKLANSLERDWMKYSENCESGVMPLASREVYRHTQTKRRRKLPILPDANLILTRDSNGKLVYREDGKHASPNP